MPYFLSEAQRLKKSLEHSLAQNQVGLVLLEGPLGAGKTTFTKTLLGQWGYPEDSVQSPTFLKLLEYDVPALGQVLHLDCYRIEESEKLDQLSLESYTEAKIWLVEWPQVFVDYFKAHATLAKILMFRECWHLEFSGDFKVVAKKTSFADLLK